MEVDEAESDQDAQEEDEEDDEEIDVDFSPAKGACSSVCAYYGCLGLRVSRCIQ